MNINDFLYNLKIEMLSRLKRMKGRFKKSVPKQISAIHGKIELTPNIIQKFMSSPGKDDRIGELERRIHRMDSELKKYREQQEQVVHVNITDSLRDQKNTRMGDIVKNGISMYRIPKGCVLWNGVDETVRGNLIDIVEYKSRAYCFYLETKKVVLANGKREERRILHVIGDKPASLLFKNPENLSIQIVNKKVSINYDDSNKFSPQFTVSA